MSNELSTPKILNCPADDPTKKTGTNFTYDFGPKGTSSGNAYVSYFTGDTTADENQPGMFISGDRNIYGIGANGSPGGAAVATQNLGYGDSTDASPYNGLGLNLGTNMNLSPIGALPQWTTRTHNLVGNVGLTDGSAQSFTAIALRQALRTSGDPNAHNCLYFPVSFGQPARLSSALKRTAPARVPLLLTLLPLVGAGDNFRRRIFSSSPGDRPGLRTRTISSKLQPHTSALRVHDSASLLHLHPTVAGGSGEEDTRI